MNPYCLITPDAVADAQVGDILELFASEGLTTIALEYVTIDAARMRRIYGGDSYTVPSGNGPPIKIADTIVDRVFDQAPGVLVDFEPQPGLTEHVLRIKGATDPFTARPGTIRYHGRDGLFNGLHCPDDDTAAEDERPILTSTPPGSMSLSELVEFAELDRLAARCNSLALEATLLRVLLRQRANAIRHRADSIVGAVAPADVEQVVDTLQATRQALARRRHLEHWLASAAIEHIGDPIVLALLARIDRHSATAEVSGAICKRDRDLLEIGLAMERHRADSIQLGR